MKIAISCVSPLVQSSLEHFLKDMLVSEEECDFVISDDEKRQSAKPLCLVLDEPYSHIRKPFSAQSLNDDLQAFDEKIRYSSKKIESTTNEIPFESFVPSVEPPVYAHSNAQDIQSLIRAVCDEHAKELSDKIFALLKEQNLIK